MSINQFELKLVSFIQEKNSISLERLSQHFNKSTSSLRRNIANINCYLPANKQFIIEKELIINKLNYTDYIHVVSSLALDDYSTSQTERISIMLCYAFFNLSLNMSGLYAELGVSLTTKKKDSKILSIGLKQQHLATEILPRKGIKIIGDEIKFRILIVSVLSPLLEINADEELTSRLANTPIENMIFSYYISKTEEEIQVTKTLIHDFLKKNQLRLSYSCKKFLYIYISIAKYRMQRDFKIAQHQEVDLTVNDYLLLPDEIENKFLNYLISSLDYSARLALPIDKKLEKITIDFIATIQDNIITKFYHKDLVFDEIYDYLYKSIIRNKYNYSFYDNKLEETKKQIANLFHIVEKAVIPIEESYHHKFSYLQLSTLTLIFKKIINENKVIGRNSKKIIVVTNSSIEKIKFFIGQLKSYVDITLIDSININELHRLNDVDYDVLITFSNRISTLLEQNDYDCIKLNFYLVREDIDKLFALGFSSAKRKLLADKVTEEISGKTKAEIKAILLEKYLDYFL